MILLSIFVFQALTTALFGNTVNNVLELEFTKRLEDDLNVLKQFIAQSFNNTLHNYETRTIKRDDDDDINDVDHKSEDDLIDEFVAFNEMFKKGLVRHVRIMPPDPRNIPQHLIDRIKLNGVKILERFSKQVIKLMNLSQNLTPILNKVTQDYENMIESQYHYINGQRPESQLDKDLFYLDLIETSSRLITDKGNELLYYTVTNLIYTDPLIYTSTKNATEILNNLIYKENFKNKKEEIKYVCTTFNICRYYPAISDYCADFISEVLKLPGKKFEEFLNMLTNIIHNYPQIFEWLCNKHYILIKQKLSTIRNNLSKMRELLGTIRTYITDKFKMIQCDDDNIRNRTKAVRMLINKIDEGLINKDETLSKSIDDAINGLRAWASGSRENYADFFQEFGMNIFDQLKKTLSNNPDGSIAELIDTIVIGKYEKQWL